MTVTDHGVVVPISRTVIRTALDPSFPDEEFRITFPGTHLCKSLVLLALGDKREIVLKFKSSPYQFTARRIPVAGFIVRPWQMILKAGLNLRAHIKSFSQTLKVVLDQAKHSLR